MESDATGEGNYVPRSNWDKASDWLAPIVFTIMLANHFFDFLPWDK